MRKQTDTYLSSFDVTLTTLTELDESTKRKLELSPEISFDEISETGDLDLMITSLPNE